MDSLSAEVREQITRLRKELTQVLQEQHNVLTRLDEETKQRTLDIEHAKEELQRTIPMAVKGQIHMDERLEKIEERVTSIQLAVEDGDYDIQIEQLRSQANATQEGCLQAMGDQRQEMDLAMRQLFASLRAKLDLKVWSVMAAIDALRPQVADQKAVLPDLDRICVPRYEKRGLENTARLARLQQVLQGCVEEFAAAGNALGIKELGRGRTSGFDEDDKLQALEKGLQRSDEDEVLQGVERRLQQELGGREQSGIPGTARSNSRAPSISKLLEL